MDFLQNIRWFIRSKPNEATNNTTFENLTEEEFQTIIFDDSTKDNVKLSFPLNDQYSFFVSREMKRPVNVKQLLTFIHKFYKEPLNNEHMEEAFEGMEEWKDEIVDYYGGDLSKLTNFDVFTDTCEPDFCGLELNEETGEYVVHIGPE